MQDNTIKVITPEDADDILGVVTLGMDEKKYVHELERLYGFPCIVRVMSFNPENFHSTSGGKNE